MPLVRLRYCPTLNYMTQRDFFVLVLVPPKDDTELMKQIWKSFEVSYELLMKISRHVFFPFSVGWVLAELCPFFNFNKSLREGCLKKYMSYGFDICHTVYGSGVDNYDYLWD